MATPSDEVLYLSPGLIVYTENGRLVAEFIKQTKSNDREIIDSHRE